MIQQEEANNNSPQEQVFTIQFITSENKAESVQVNKKILDQLEPINLSYNPFDQIQYQGQDNEPLIISNIKNKFEPSVYKYLQQYIKAHKDDNLDQNNTNQQTKQPYSCKHLKDLISEKDYQIVKSMKRSELFQLANLADYLNYKALVQLLFQIIMFKLAGKSPEEITKWLESDS